MRKIMAIAGLIGTLMPGTALAYGYGGHHWDQGNPTQVPVQIDATILGAWIAPIAHSMSAWNQAGAKFRFTSGTSGHKVSFKYVSDPRALAVTFIREWFGTRITDRDTDISTRFPWDIDGRAGSYDIQNVMTHEFGHWLMLDDLYSGADSAKTMFGSAAPGEVKKRSLEQDDKNGIKVIYGW